MYEELALEGKSPPALESRPAIVGLEWLWEAYLDLTTERPPSMNPVPQPIPWGAMQKYKEVSGWTIYEKFVAERVVRHLDGVCCKFYRDRAKADHVAAKAEANRVRR